MKSDPNGKNKNAVLVYIPVIHEGYRRFFDKHKKNSDLYIFGKDLIKRFGHLYKDIRALDPSLIKKSIENWKFFENIFITGKKELKKIGEAKKIIMPDEDIMHELASDYFPGKKIIFDSVFLRWDKHNSIKENPVKPDKEVSREEFDRKIIRLAAKESEKSSDWWRRVGSVIVKGGKVIIAVHNQHLPSAHTPYVNGDPRNNFHKGDHVEISTSFHSEAAAIAEAARKGISLEGASMYVSTFPCPPCAKVIAHSGIKKLYYAGGYGVLDGEDILKGKGVEIILVDEKVKIKKDLGYTEYEKK
ncbi:MAG: deaminase [Patescibacteria group bacterium]